jgi:hypothetical protein
MSEGISDETRRRAQKAGRAVWRNIHRCVGAEVAFVVSWLITDDFPAWLLLLPLLGIAGLFVSTGFIANWIGREER